MLCIVNYLAIIRIKEALERLVCTENIFLTNDC